MAEQALILEDFSGGIASISEKKAPPNSAGFVKALDVSVDPASLTPFQKPIKVSGSNVTDLPKWAVEGSPSDTSKYFVDASGNLYKETSGGSWIVIRSGSTISSTSASPTGQGLYVFNNYLYYASSFALGRYGPLSLTPAFNDNFLDDGARTVDNQQTAAGTTYTPPTSISESAVNQCAFIPTKNPFSTIGTLFMSVKGTGSMTMTLHDADNNAISTVTIPNGSLPTAGNQFTIGAVGTTPPVDLILGNTYHFHITSSVADSQIRSTVLNDLSTVGYKQYIATLESDADWHPMIEHLNMLVIASGRYLATWDEVTYSPNKIVLPPGFRIRALTKDQEFVVAACWRGTTIDGVEEGRLYYWDGIAPTYNFYKTVDVGLPNAITSSRNRLLGVYGSSGDIYIGSDPFQRVQQLPKLAHGKKSEVYPGAITNWQGITMIGYGGSTDDASGLIQGVYAYGSRNDALPDALSYAFPPSTGTTQGTSLKIGMVKAFGNSLYVGWRDGSSYGVDKVLKTDVPASACSWESLIFDNNSPMKSKIAFQVTLTFTALVSGDSITPKYKINRGSWVTGSAVTTVGATRAQLLVNSRFKEIEFGFDYTPNTSTFQKVTQVSLTFDDCVEEDNET